MNQYHFHLRTPAGLQDAIAPLEFGSLEEAYMDVVLSIPDAAGHLLMRGWDPMQCSYVIADGNGEELMDVPFSELVTQAAGDPRLARKPVPLHHASATKPAGFLSSEMERTERLRLSSRQACARAAAARADSVAAVIRSAELRARHVDRWIVPR